MRYVHKNSIFDKVAVIGNYVPRKCGLATFTADVCEALKSEAGDNREIYAIAINDIPEGYDYPEMVRLELEEENLSCYSQHAPELLNFNNTDALIVQHEYGIYGGDEGEHIISLMESVHMPIITTLHTVLSEPNPQQRKVTQRIMDLSSRVVVMSEHAKNILAETYPGLDPNKIVMIPHGIPNISFVDPDYYKDDFDAEGKKIILTFGLLSPGKGIEVVIRSLPEIVAQNPDVIYMVLGATHPNIIKHDGEEYRESLKKLSRDLGVENHVRFIDEFVSLEKLCEYIGAADIYVTPYHNAQQITSGTLAYALGAGKAIVSTPYRYAEELLDEGRGILFPFNDHKALAKSVNLLLGDESVYRVIRKKAYQYGRGMTWSKVADSYLKLIEEVILDRGSVASSSLNATFVSEQPQFLPEVDLRHLYTLTDDTGILQHATYAIPNRLHGYCTDDNARALVVAAEYYNRKSDPSVLALAQTYLAFLLEAFNEDSKRFRNFMSYNRNWLEKHGSQDSHARALWSLGVCAGSKLGTSMTRLAGRLFVEGLSFMTNTSSPRAWAFALIGIYHYSKHYPGNVSVHRTAKVLCDRLTSLFNKNIDDGWTWCEKKLTYANARIPQALLLAGNMFGDKDLIDLGYKSLRWLIDIQTHDKGHISIIGNRGWKSKSGSTARFDQQPIDAGALVEACIDAYNISSDSVWVEEAFRIFKWFLGYNDLNAPLYDPETGGCKDGLNAIGPNENQGAESTLVWLLSLLAMYKLPIDYIDGALDELAEDYTLEEV